MREVYSRKPSVNFPVVLNRSVKVGAESYQRGVDLTHVLRSAVQPDLEIKYSSFVKTPRQPEIRIRFGFGGRKKARFCCASELQELQRF